MTSYLNLLNFEISLVFISNNHDDLFPLVKLIFGFCRWFSHFGSCTREECFIGSDFQWDLGFKWNDIIRIYCTFSDARNSFILLFLYVYPWRVLPFPILRFGRKKYDRQRECKSQRHIALSLYLYNCIYTYINFLS